MAQNSIGYVAVDTSPFVRAHSRERRPPNPFAAAVILLKRTEPLPWRAFLLIAGKDDNKALGTRAELIAHEWQGSRLQEDGMSETGLGSSSTVKHERWRSFTMRPGGPISRGRPEQDLETLVRFSREQPLATALIALGIGYLLGKML